MMKGYGREKTPQKNTIRVPLRTPHVMIWRPHEGKTEREREREHVKIPHISIQPRERQCGVVQ